MAVSKWFWSLLLICIPIVGIVMLFIWAFGSEDDERRNFARAVLLWEAVCLCLGVIFGIFSALLGIAMFAS